MKKIRKLIPVSLYDIPGLEGWLEEQANQGLFPEHLGSWATFRTGAAPGTRFRLDAFVETPPESPGKPGPEPSEEQLELYRQSGWEYAFAIGQAYFLFYATDPGAPELFNDYQSHGMALDRLTKQVRRCRTFLYVRLAILVLACLLPLILPVSKFDVQPDRLAVYPSLLLFLFQPAVLFGGIWFLLSSFQQFREFRLLLDLHRRFKDGLPPKPSPGPSRAYIRRKVLLTSLSTLVLLLLIGWKVMDRPIPLEDFSRPYVALADLEQEPLFSYEELFGKPGYWEEANTVQRNFSLLAPIWYTVTEAKHSAQAGTQANTFSPDPQDGKYRYSPSLEAVYCRLTVPALNRLVARSFMHGLRPVNVRWSYEEVDCPGTDFVILATERDGVWQMTAVGKGSRVAVFCYAGQEQLANHLDVLTALVAG